MVRKRKTDYEELIRKQNFSGYAEEVSYIKRLMEEGKVKPILNSGLNGKKPAMYKRYWLFEEELEDPEMEDEVKYRLSPLLDTDFYLKHMDVYAKERKFVRKLSDFLMKRRGELCIAVSENERSYAIWGREKFLSGHCQESAKEGVKASELLRHCGIGLEFLNVYRTAEPMALYACSKAVPQNVLILENLDPFYGMRKVLMSGKKTLFGISIGTLIYGGGKRVSGYFENFELFAEDYLKAEGNHFYYFGDLDYEGIGIYENFSIKMKGVIEVMPFVPAYENLIKNVRMEDLPYSKEKQNHNIKTIFWDYFPDAMRAKMMQILESGKYIPQERLSVMDY